MHLLLLEDDIDLGQAVVDHLEAHGHAVHWCKRIVQAAAALDGAAPVELALLDLHLPDGDGIDLLRRWRAAGDRRAVIVLTARDQVSDRVRGLQTGADDYLVKPFDLDELKARLRALLRRSAGRAELRIEHAGVTLDPASQQVSYQGRPVPMTPKEYLLLHELLSQPGKVLTRERLVQLLYGWDEEAESNTLEVHIHHLRRKLFSGLIRTVRGVGYLVEEQA